MLIAGLIRRVQNGFPAILSTLIRLTPDVGSYLTTLSKIEQGPMKGPCQIWSG